MLQRCVGRSLFCTAVCVWSTVIPSTRAYAQTQSAPVPSAQLTLEQALELGESRSESIAIAQAGVRHAEGDRVRARSGLWPQLSASGGYDRTLATEFGDLFSGGGSTCREFSATPAAPLADRVSEIERAIDCGAIGSNLFGNRGTVSLPFGRTNIWHANLAFSQNLYSGGRNGAQTALATAGRNAAELTVTSERAQLLFEVTQAYYDAALSDRLVAIANATLQQSNATLRQTDAAFRAGTQPEFELLRARVSRDSQTPLLIRQRANRDIAMLRLKQLLQLPAAYDLRIADALSDEMLPPPSVFAARVVPIETVIRAADPLQATVQRDIPVPDRSVVKQASAGVRASEATLKAALAERMPSLSLSSSYGRVAYPSNGLPVARDFRTNWTVGLGLQVPILTGGRLRGDALVARADLDAARVRLQQTQELAELDTRSAWAELVAARAAWEATGGTVQQAQRAYEIAEVRYRSGVSTQLELSDSQLLLEQAQANRALAARDLQVARARVALLPDLSLGNVAPLLQQQQPASPAVPPQPQTGSAGQLINASVVQGQTRGRQ